MKGNPIITLGSQNINSYETIEKHISEAITRLNDRYNEIIFMHWQHQESPVNMIHWCSWLLGG